MNSIQCRILVFLVLLTSCFSPVCGKDKKPRQAIEKLSIDGPYLLKADDGSMRAISVDGKGRLLDKHYKSIPTTFSFEVFSDNGERLFPVTIHSVSRPEWKDVQPEKTFVLSDPHANWSCFASLLKAGKVIDADYNWIFGTNQLVIIGDVFDRGVDVLPINWLIYKLEKEAEDAGGKVTFLIGNHETMVLGNDLRYTKKKYTQLADTLGMTYPELWQKSELGHWLKTRNSIQVVGDNLFVHAGLSKEFLPMGTPSRRKVMRLCSTCLPERWNACAPVCAASAGMFCAVTPAPTRISTLSPARSTSRPRSSAPSGALAACPLVRMVQRPMLRTVSSAAKGSARTSKARCRVHATGRPAFSAALRAAA